MKPKHSIPVKWVSQDTHTPHGENTRQDAGERRPVPGGSWGRRQGYTGAATAALQAVLYADPGSLDGKQSIEEAISGVSGCLLKALSWSRNHRNCSLLTNGLGESCPDGKAQGASVLREGPD